MLFDIFSSFDPWTNLTGKSTFTMTAFGLLPAIFFLPLWSHSPSSNLLLAPFSYSCQIPESNTSALKGLSPLYLLLMFYILGLNWTGLMPYFCSSTSHLMITLTLALPCWLSSLFSSLTNNTSSFISNFLPTGAPGWLNPFLLVIELISTLVRPLTLSFRLAANISTGHVMMIIMGLYMAYSVSVFNLPNLFILTAIKLGYLMFEVAIGLLQTYIFILLLTLYTNEHT